jgi:hypothetical protein
MTMSINQMGEGQRLQPLTLVEPSNQQEAGTTPDLTDLLGAAPSRSEAEANLRALLPKLAEELPQIDNNEDERVHFGQVGRIVSVLLHRDVQEGDIHKAMDACLQLNKLERGYCLVHLLGEDSTAENRALWIDIYEQQLSEAIRELTGAMPEQVAA